MDFILMSWLQQTFSVATWMSLSKDKPLLCPNWMSPQGLFWAELKSDLSIFTAVFRPELRVISQGLTSYFVRFFFSWSSVCLFLSDSWINCIVWKRKYFCSTPFLWPVSTYTHVFWLSYNIMRFERCWDNRIKNSIIKYLEFNTLCFNSLSLIWGRNKYYW